jgi:uncharacterized membrane protein
MVKVEQSVVIGKLVEEVFAYSQDIKNAAKFQSGVDSLEMVDGPDNTVGSKYAEVRHFLGKEMRTTLEITAFKENELWGARVIEGPLPYEVTMRYEAIPEGTKITTTVEAEPKGFFKLAEKVVASSLEKSLAEDFATLKKLLEG